MCGGGSYPVTRRERRFPTSPLQIQLLGAERHRDTLVCGEVSFSCIPTCEGVTPPPRVHHSSGAEIRRVHLFGVGAEETAPA